MLKRKPLLKLKRAHFWQDFIKETNGFWIKKVQKTNQNFTQRKKETKNHNLSRKSREIKNV